MLGTMAGSAIYVVCALAIESFFMPSRGGPTMSYGQYAGLICIPSGAVIGAASGLALAFAWIRRWLASLSLLLMVALGGAAAVLRMWNQQIAEYGRDPSEMVLFYPLLALCAMAAIGSIAIAAIAVADRHSTATKEQTN